MCLYSEAENAYLKAITDDGSKVLDFAAHNITFTYNLARLYEDCFKLDRVCGCFLLLRYLFAL
jgi:hypothetical protein